MELPDLPQEQKDKIVEDTLKACASMLIMCMRVIKVENFINGNITNDADGVKYELNFKRIHETPPSPPES